MLATSSTIKSLIQSKISHTEQDIFDRFIHLLDQYRINYVMVNQVPYFVVSNLAKAKGLETKDFSKNYITEGTCSLAGSFRKIEGESLAKFKDAWVQAGNYPLDKAKSLWVTNWRGCYSYLSQGLSTISKQVQDLGADAIETVVSNVVPLHPPTPYLKLVDTPKEADIQELISLLSSYTSRHFRREVTVPNHLDSSTKTRRFDLVEVTPRQVRIYELKREALTPAHISQTLGDKGYIDLAKVKYPRKKLKFIFLAPTITPEASRLINLMPNTSYTSLTSLVTSLVKEIEDDTPAEGRWFIKERILPQFSALIPDIKRLMPA